MRSGTFKLLTGAALAASAMLVAQSAAAFDFGGYFRAGAGVNGEGGRQVCYRLPGAQADFRLGNECETVYAELVLSDVVYEEGATSAGFHTRVAYISYSQSQNDFAGTAGGTSDVNLPEFWAYVENPFGNGATWWAGKRFYRYGIHINDFFYWNNSGTGGGFTGLDLGFAELSYATIFNASVPLEEQIFDASGDPLNTDDASAVKQVLQLKGIQTNPGGNLQFAFMYTFANASGDVADPTPRNRDGDNNGWSVLVQHTQTDFLLDGSVNRLIFQYGQAAGAELDSAAYPLYDSDIKTFRVIDALVFNITPDFSTSIVGLYQHTKNAEDAETLPENWTQVGGRFVYYLTDNFRLNLEASTTWTEGALSDETSRLSKITFAPAITVGRGFFARPELRLFATYADWDTPNGFAPLQSGLSDEPFSGSNGWTFGIQAEVWW